MMYMANHDIKLLLGYSLCMLNFDLELDLGWFEGLI